MMVSIHGDWFWLWNVIDDASRFHLASVISKQRSTKDTRKVFKVAKKTSKDQRPEFIIIDGLGSYIQAINKDFKTMKRETIHVGKTGLEGKKYRSLSFDNNLIERMHGEIRAEGGIKSNVV